MLRFVVPLALFVTLGALLFVGLDRDPRLVPSPLVGKPVPEFSLPRVRDPRLDLAKSDLLGKVTLLNVWASWCVACRVEHPLLLDVARRGEVPIFGLNYKDMPGDAVQWLDRLGDPYVASGSDQAGRVGLDLGVYGVPESFLIDRNGEIAYKHIGPITAQDWETTIRPLIERLKGTSG